MDNLKRRSFPCFWISLVAGISLLCFVIVYIGFYAEYKYSSTVPNPAVVVSEKLTEEECIKVCNTKECVEQSRRILNNIHATVEPCEDFYNFACGGFLEKVDPEKPNSFLTRHISYTRNKLKKLIDNLEASPESASGKIKTVYDSCLEFGSSENEALSNFFKILNDIGIIGWPHLAPDYKFVEPGIAGVVSHLLLYKEYGFVDYSVEYYKRGDQNHKTNLIVGIGESPYGKRNPELRKQHLVRILKYFNLDTETVDIIWKDSEAILNAIESLVGESETILDEDENSTSPFKWGMECTKDVRGEWEELCESLEIFINYTRIGERVNKNYANIPYSELYFMKNVFRVLGNFSDRSIANYLVLNVFLNHLNELNFYFRLLTQDHPNSQKLKMYDPILHWEHCVDWIMSHMTLALAHEYLKDGSTFSLLEEVQELTKELIQETKEIVSRQDWIPDDILKNVINKIQNIDHISQHFIFHIATNETLVNFCYEKFNPSKRSFLLNAFEYRRFEEVLKMNGFAVEILTVFPETLFMPGASGGGGELTINPGILLPPIYTPGLDRLINLVTLGTMIAHEVGHNVDFFLHQEYKYNMSSNNYYKEIERCMSKQFSEFRVESLRKNLDGSKDSVENTADNMAVSVIDKLIKKYLANGVDISLPSLPYTTKQLLYISSAQNWCSVSTKAEAEDSFETDIHSPMNFRLIGTMQNSKGFADAFGCPEGSYMNPSIKCNFLTESESD